MALLYVQENGHGLNEDRDSADVAKVQKLKGVRGVLQQRVAMPNEAVDISYECTSTQAVQVQVVLHITTR